jgi:hypothetical protein
MAHEHVKRGRLKSRISVFLPAPVKIDLPEAEEVEVVDKERADDYHYPPNPEKRYQHVTPGAAFYSPHHIRHRPPLPEEEGQDETRQQNVSAALDGLRGKPHPPAFECRARHDAMLDGEEDKEQNVNQ